jgi:hypothetical protein
MDIFGRVRQKEFPTYCLPQGSEENGMRVPQSLFLSIVLNAAVHAVFRNRKYPQY